MLGGFVTCEEPYSSPGGGEHTKMSVKFVLKQAKTCTEKGTLSQHVFKSKILEGYPYLPEDPISQRNFSWSLKIVRSRVAAAVVTGMLRQHTIVT